MMAVYGLPLGLMFSGYLIEYLAMVGVLCYTGYRLDIKRLVTFKWRNVS